MDLSDCFDNDHRCKQLRWVDGGWEVLRQTWLRLDGTRSRVPLVEEAKLSALKGTVSLHSNGDVWLRVHVPDRGLTYDVAVPRFVTYTNLQAISSGEGLHVMINSSRAVWCAAWMHDHAIDGECLRVAWDSRNHTSGTPVLLERGDDVWLVFVNRDTLVVKNRSGKMTLYERRYRFPAHVAAYSVEANGRAILCFNTAEVMTIDVATGAQRTYHLTAMGVPPRALCVVAASPLRVGEVALGCCDGTVAVADSAFSRAVEMDEPAMYRDLCDLLRRQFWQQCKAIDVQEVEDCYRLPADAANPPTGTAALFAARCYGASNPENRTLRLVVGAEAPYLDRNLVVAAIRDKLRVAELLLMYTGPTQNEIDCALRYAITRGNLPLVQLLFTYGAKPAVEFEAPALLSAVYRAMWNSALLLAICRAPPEIDDLMVSEILARCKPEDFGVGVNPIWAMTSPDFCGAAPFRVMWMQRLLERGCPMDLGCLQTIVELMTVRMGRSDREEFWSAYTMRLILDSGIDASAATLLLDEISEQDIVITDDGLRRHRNAIGTLLASGANPNNENPSVPLCRAIERGDLLTVGRLLKAGALVGAAPLLIASSREQERCLSLCLVQGLHPPRSVSLDALTRAAAMTGRIDVQRWLKAFGADVSGVSDVWSTATHHTHCLEMTEAVYMVMLVAASLRRADAALPFLAPELWYLILTFVPAASCWWPLWWQGETEI